MKNKLKNWKKRYRITSVCLLITVLLISCASKKITTTEVRQENRQTEKTADSAMTRRIVKDVTARLVPADTAQTGVAISVIENLPEGAKFTKKNSRASVELKRINDTIIITATCDSLQRLIEHYELEIESHNRKSEQKNSETATVETTYRKKTYSPFLAFFSGVAAGGLAVLIFANKKSIFDTVLNIIKKLFK